MPRLPEGIRRAFRLAALRRPIEQEVDAEVAFHIEMRTAELVDRGLTPDAARAEARRRFGDTREWSNAMSAVDREHAAEHARREHFADLRQDVRYGIRAAIRAPLFSLLAIATLALGIGANAAVFGVVKSVLLDALPFADAGRLVRVYGRLLDGTQERGPLTAGTIADVVERQRSFSRLAAFANSPREAVLAGSGDPQVVRIEYVEPSFFPTLGISAAMGRTLRDDDAADTVRMVMITHGAWQTLFGGDASIVGRDVRVNGISRTIVGVLPRTFVGPVGDADFYYAFAIAPLLRDPISARGAGWLGMIGRLKPGVDVEAARRDLAAIAADIAREHPREAGGMTVATIALREALVGDTRRPLLVLMVSAGLVLLITCANLAGALLSRTISRRKEFAVRIALGAGRGRVVRQLLTESVLLSLAGGVAGVLLAQVGLMALRTLARNALPDYADLSLDTTALLATAALAVVTGIAFGLAPALSVRRAGAQSTLREESRGTSESHRARRLRGALVAGQIALCVSLLTGAGLLVRSLVAMTSSPLGFRPDGVLTLNVQLPGGSYRKPETWAPFFDALEQRLAGLPGVSAAADAGSLPTNVMQNNGIVVLGADQAANATPVFVMYAPVSDDYFRTLGIPLRQGRVFSAQDGPNAPPTMVISQAMARRFWPKGDALGAQVRMGPNPNATPYTVVGIVGDVRNDLARADAEPMMYGTSRQDTRPFRMLLLRTSGDPLSLVHAVRTAISSIDPGVPMRDAAALPDFISDRLTPRRLPVVLMTAFGALALLLASVGVYAMFANMAAAREREFGVRVALGSSPARIATLVLRQGGVWMALGLAAGAGGIVLVARSLRELLYGVRPFDPLTLGTAAFVLLACGAMALLVPVRRATRVDPITTLR